MQVEAAMPLMIGTVAGTMAGRICSRNTFATLLGLNPPVKNQT